MTKLTDLPILIGTFCIILWCCSKMYHYFKVTFILTYHQSSHTYDDSAHFSAIFKKSVAPYVLLFLLLLYKRMYTQLLGCVRSDNFHEIILIYNIYIIVVYYIGILLSAYCEVVESTEFKNICYLSIYNIIALHFCLVCMYLILLKYIVWSHLINVVNAKGQWAYRYRAMMRVMDFCFDFYWFI